MRLPIVHICIYISYVYSRIHSSSFFSYSNGPLMPQWIIFNDKFVGVFRMKRDALSFFLIFYLSLSRSLWDLVIQPRTRQTSYPLPRYEFTRSPNTCVSTTTQKKRRNWHHKKEEYWTFISVESLNIFEKCQILTDAASGITKVKIYLECIRKFQIVLLVFNRHGILWKFDDPPAVWKYSFEMRPTRSAMVRRMERDSSDFETGILK